MTELFNEKKLTEGLTTAWAGRPLFFYESTDSTNVRAKELAAQGAGHGTLLVANEQTAGRGRRGRVWDSPPGSNLYFTLVLSPMLPSDKVSMLTLVMAMAVADGIRKAYPQGGEKVGIKWPNDIVVDGRKVCGILTELILSNTREPESEHTSGAINYLVVGVGINVGHQIFARELMEKATSLEDAFDIPYSRTELLNHILLSFEKYYDIFVEEGNLTPLKEEYNRLLVNCGRQVRVLDPGAEFTGVALGIDDEGQLLVERQDGSIQKVYAGEVSVRGIYGYV